MPELWMFVCGGMVVGFVIFMAGYVVGHRGESS